MTIEESKYNIGDKVFYLVHYGYTGEGIKQAIIQTKVYLESNESKEWNYESNDGKGKIYNILGRTLEEVKKGLKEFFDKERHKLEDLKQALDNDEIKFLTDFKNQ